MPGFFGTRWGPENPGVFSFLVEVYNRVRISIFSPSFSPNKSLIFF